MRNVKGFSAFFLMVLLAYGPALSQTTQAQEVEQQIRTLNAREVDALLRNDVDTLNVFGQTISW